MPLVTVRARPPSRRLRRSPEQARVQPAPAPPGLRFDQLARTSLHRWWRPLVGTLALVCAYWIFQFILARPLTAVLRAVLGPNSINIALTMGLPAALLAARWVQRRPVGSLSSVAGRLRRHWLLLCGGLALVYLLPLFITWAILLDVSAAAPTQGAGWVGWQRFLLTGSVIALIGAFEAAAQEYVFRGWLPQAFGAYLRSPWPGIIVSSALFSLIHPAAYASAWAVVQYTLFGVVFAVLTIRTGGLEAALALHTIHNWALLLPAAAAGLVDTPAPAAVDWAAVPWQRILTGEALALAVFTALVLRLATRRRIATTT
ncbi:MAG: lysostaphin resistance A-like protein [Egibacteraceae bacterium]